MTRRLAAFVAFALAAPVSAAAGQTVNDLTGAIVGRVTDQTAALLPGVRVEISSPGLMTPFATSTNAEGAYRLLALPPAEYTLVFSRQGFVTRSHSVLVSLGVTKTVDVDMIAGLSENVNVLGAAPVLDRKSPSVTISFDAAQLANLPGTRSMGAILSATPAVHLARFDIGGSAGLISPVFSAYDTGGRAYPMLEGIFIGRINPYGLTLDYGSFQEVSVTSAAFGHDNQLPGPRVQFVTKSGGNRYHGSFYADYEDRRWQASNIDQTQIERVAVAGDSLSRDANRLWSYHDLNADVGGYIRKNRLWWYASSRRQAVSVRLVSFPVKPYRTEVWNFTVKGTYLVNDRHKVVLFANVAHDHEPNLLAAFRPAGSPRTQLSSIHPLESSTSKRLASGSITKAEWTWEAGNSMFAEVRVGRFAPRQEEIPNGRAPRFENITTTEVSGGNRDWEATASFPQLLASTTWFTDGWLGSHQVKVGAEIIRLAETIAWRRAYPGNVLHVLQNNQSGEAQPEEMYRFSTPSRSDSGVWWFTAYVNDAWQMNARLSLNLGVRFDRQRAFLPEQFHPSGPVTATTQVFAAVDNLIDWNVVSPRVGLVYDLTGAGTTLAKASYGLFSGGASPALGFSANPNSDQPWDRYDWVDDNGDGFWQQGEEKGQLATRGVEKIDPALKLGYTRELVLSVEQELAGGVALRSGLVWRGLREPQARQDANRPWSAYTVETTFRDPGPNGVAGDDDDGRDITAYPSPSGPSNNSVRNVAGAGTDHWTLDITAVKRSRSRWSLVAGFAHTWSRDHNNEYAGELIRQNALPLTPNDVINTGDAGRHEFTMWTAKIHSTFDLPWTVRFTPFLRHQSGQPFGRTVANPVSGVTRILAEPIGARRMDHLTSLDLRVEKGFRLSHGRVAAFMDVFNVLNANSEQNISWVSGRTFLRPITIVPPRIARIGVKVDW